MVQGVIPVYTCRPRPRLRRWTPPMVAAQRPPSAAVLGSGPGAPSRPSAPGAGRANAPRPPPPPGMDGWMDGWMDGGYPQFGIELKGDYCQL